MSNLVEQYGVEWFIRKFNYCYFMHDGVPHQVNSGSGSSWRTQVPCKKLAVEADVVTMTDTRVQSEFFTDISIFSVPNLGWRSYDKGRSLLYLHRNNNSYDRGLSTKNLVVEASNLTRWLMFNAGYRLDTRNQAAAYHALLPTFIPLTEGIAKIRNEEILSFAVSPTIAVMAGAGDTMIIMFRKKQAGVIRPDNSLSLVVPELTTLMENN